MAPKRSPEKAINSEEEPAAAASSTESRPASESSSFVEDTGPVFDAERAAAEPPPEPPPAEQAEQLLEEWEEEAIGSLLQLKGRVMHAGLGVAEEDWLYTELDLAAICPPLTRICNRYPAIRQYAGFADPITLVTAFGAYATRSMLERREELIRRASEETEVTIAPAEDAPVPEATPSVPAPPPPQRPSSFAAGGGVPQEPAPTSTRAASPRGRPGEAEIDLDQVEWEVGS